MTVRAVYVGTREAMVAEVAAWDPMEIGISKGDAKYLVMIDGDGQYDTGWFGSKKLARQEAEWLAKEYDVKVCWVD